MATARAAIVLIAGAAGGRAIASERRGSVGAAPQLCDKYAPPALSDAGFRRVRAEGVRMRVRVRPDTRVGQTRLEIAGLAHVPAPVDTVLRVLTDFGAYADFVPRVTRSEPVSLSDGPAWSVRIRTPFPLDDVVTVTRPVTLRCGPRHWLVHWRRAGGDLVENRGVTVVYDAPAGGTLLRQRSVVATDVRLPSAYIGRGVRRYCHYVLAAIRERAARLAITPGVGPPLGPPPQVWTQPGSGMAEPGR